MHNCRHSTITLHHRNKSGFRAYLREEGGLVRMLGERLVGFVSYIAYGSFLSYIWSTIISSVRKYKNRLHMDINSKALLIFTDRLVLRVFVFFRVNRKVMCSVVLPCFLSVISACPHRYRRVAWIARARDKSPDVQLECFRSQPRHRAARLACVYSQCNKHGFVGWLVQMFVVNYSYLIFPRALSVCGFQPEAAVIWYLFHNCCFFFFSSSLLVYGRQPVAVLALASPVRAGALACCACVYSSCWECASKASIVCVWAFYGHIRARPPVLSSEGLLVRYPAVFYGGVTMI